MVRKVVKVIVIVLAIGFLVLQFIRPDLTNPAVVESETLAAATQVPADVQQILTRSCGDCHSNRTIYPWYSNVSPFNWFLVDHIDEGRRELNFSQWNTYSEEKKIRKLEEICDQVEREFMPLPSYLWIHRDAVVSASDRKLLCDWTKAESTRISASDLPNMIGRPE